MSAMELLGKRFTGVFVQVGVNNLLNKSDVASCNTATYCYFGRSRTLVSSLRYQWQGGE